MNVQPKPSPDCPPTPMPMHERRVPAGPRAFLAWPVELEVEPWRP